MKDRPERIALFPGSFDPIHLGHLDIILRAAALFDRVVVGVGNNPDKQTLLDIDARVAIVREAVADVPNASVEPFTGLTVEVASELGAVAIVRGVRNAADLDYEAQMAVTNHEATGAETVFMLPAAKYAFFSSRLIRQIARGGGEISTMVPKAALPYLADKKA